MHNQIKKPNGSKFICLVEQVEKASRFPAKDESSLLSALRREAKNLFGFLSLSKVFPFDELLGP